jgi:hypothetical protein
MFLPKVDSSLEDMSVKDLEIRVAMIVGILTIYGGTPATKILNKLRLGHVIEACKGTLHDWQHGRLFTRIL